tara:strand:- start:295 stop:1500 length:1206 start_codon:yes stop_codon:yes gene_type:complete
MSTGNRSACIDQLVNELVDDVNGFFNVKAQVLRSLFVNRKQFENLIERDCDGKLNGQFMHNYSESDLDFMENYLKIFELGLDQLEEFIGMLQSAEGLLNLDECSILYYLRQLLNGPFACAAYDISKLLSGESINLLASVNDGIGTLGNAVRGNISTTVYGLEPFNAALDLYNKLPPYMQDNIQKGTRAATNVFNYNFECSCYNDNTLPFIDKFPKLRVNNEFSQGFTNFAAGNLNLKDIPFFNNLRDISNNIFESIKSALGPAANKLFEFRKFVNTFYIKGSEAFSILNGVNRLLISLDRTEYTVKNRIIQQKCESALTSILGTPISTDDTYTIQICIGDGIYDICTIGGQFPDDGASTTSRLPELPELPDIPEDELAAAPVSIVKKELCEDEGECKDLNF